MNCTLFIIQFAPIGIQEVKEAAWVFSLQLNDHFSFVAADLPCLDRCKLPAFLPSHCTCPMVIVLYAAF